MKTKLHNKQRGVQQPPKLATKRPRRFKAQTVGLIRPTPIELLSGVEDEEALVVAESLDEREKRG